MIIQTLSEDRFANYIHSANLTKEVIYEVSA